MLQREFDRAASRGVGVGSNPEATEASISARAPGMQKPGQYAAVGGSWSALTPAGEATNLNLVHLNGFDALDVEDLTRAEMAGRAQVVGAMDALRSEVIYLFHSMI